MENRKLIKFLIPILILGFFVANFNSAFAYDAETHAYLTSGVIKLYNQNFSNNKISDDLIPYLLDGARREDDPPRWMNHFYDPINNRGLTDSILGTWQKSKDWAQNDDNQNKLTYKVPATIASILSAIQQKKISALTIETNFTWQEAIRYWVNGEKEKAMFALGHTLHLMEDSSVPDHTRNDPHPGNSPYEKHTKKFTLNNPDKKYHKDYKIKKPIISDNLNSYFDGLAEYSNNNFYSKDTIGIQSGYKIPEPVEYERIEDIFFSLGKDDLGFYKLSAQPIESSILVNTKGEVTIDDNRVLQDYWSRLSTKSVQYGAGVVNLFFQEVEKAKNDPNFTKTEEKSLLGKAIDSTKSFFAQVSSTVGNFFSGIFGTDQGFQPAGQVSLNDSQSQDFSMSGDRISDTNTNNNQYSGSPISETQEVQSPKINNQSAAPINQIQAEPRSERSSATGEEADQEIIPEIQESQKLIENQTQKEQLQIQQTQPLLIPKECSFATSQSPSRQKIIINEVAWMGGSSDFGLTAADEWIELKNVSNGEINLNGWQILDKSEKTRIVFDDSAKISANSFYLLERTNDDSAPNVFANSIYTGTLNNTDEGLRFFDNECNLIDEVFAEPNWPAGDNTQKRTMERSPDLSWHTYNGTAQNGIFGTPKKENSAPTIIFSDGGGGGSSSSNISVDNQQQITDSTSSPEKILINEIQIAGVNVNDEFIELYNPNSQSIDLTGWSIKRKSSSDNEYSLLSASRLEGKTIPANGYFLAGNEDGYSNIIVADIFWAKSNTVSKDNTVILYDGSQNIIDKVGFGLAADCDGNCALNPDTNQSIQRKSFIDTDNNSNDFEIQTCPSPKAPSKTCQQANQAPSAFFVYSPSNLQIGDLIAFDAASSTDPDGQIISYEWNFGDNTTSSISTATTTHTYSQTGNYSVSLIVFDNQNASSTTTSTIVSVASSTPASPAPQLSETNHIVISEIYPDSTDNNFDFIELYNPTNSSIELKNYSLKIRKEFATSTNSLSSFTSSHIITAKSFFLVGFDNYGSSTYPTTDVLRKSYSLLTSTSSIIYLIDNNVIIDEVIYNPLDLYGGRSLERRAFSDSQCVSAQNDNEFLGNACDTDSAADFEIRDVPNPQNSSSLPEPRTAPTTPENFTVQYSANTMELNFNWSASQAVSTSTYKITDISDASSTLSTIETASTTAKISINEIGRDYQFSIQAFDSDGLNSESATSTIFVQSFLSNLYFYQDPRASSTDYLIDAYYDQYPFVPDLFEQGSRWKILVFYLNGESPESILPIKYKQCSSNLIMTADSLILPDTQTNCGVSGGTMNYAFAFDQLEDNHFFIYTADSSSDKIFTFSDYIIIAYYSTYDWAIGREYGFKLVAVDKTKYYFQENPPEHFSPEILGDLQFTFDDESLSLVTSWLVSDPDTLDSLLKYEISYDEGESWQAVAKPSHQITVEWNTVYNIQVRVIDDFGLQSAIVKNSFTTPPETPSLEQNLIQQTEKTTPAVQNGNITGFIRQNLGNSISGTFSEAILHLRAGNTENTGEYYYYLAVFDTSDDNNWSKLCEVNKVIDDTFLTKQDVFFQCGEPKTFISGHSYQIYFSYLYDSHKDYNSQGNFAGFNIWGSTNPDSYPDGQAIFNSNNIPVADIYFKIR